MPTSPPRAARRRHFEPGTHRVPWETDRSSALQKLFEFIDAKPGVPNDSGHGERVNRVVTRDRQNALSIGHSYMFALSLDPKADFLQGADCREMVDAGKLRQR